MKRIVLLLVFIGTAFFTVVAAPDKELSVKSSSGTTSCAIKDIKCITFEDGVMLVSMKNGSAVSWNTDWLNCITFESALPGQETAVMGVALPATFLVRDNVIAVDCCVASLVQLCACDGKVVFEDICTGNFSLDMNALPSGIYLLNIDGRIYKIMNR